MRLTQATGNVPFNHRTGQRQITREALRDLAGRYGEVSENDPDEILIDHFSSIIDSAATRYPNVVITGEHLPV
jgi:hypothetical protein